MNEAEKQKKEKKKADKVANRDLEGFKDKETKAASSAYYADVAKDGFIGPMPAAPSAISICGYDVEVTEITQDYLFGDGAAGDD